MTGWILTVNIDSMKILIILPLTFIAGILAMPFMIIAMWANMNNTKQFLDTMGIELARKLKR